jgi:hypothetical protein
MLLEPVFNGVWLCAGLASSLCCLELDSAAHQHFLQEPCMWLAVGGCTGLQTLLLHIAKPQGFSIAKYSLENSAWRAAVQPLAGLTRLEVGAPALSYSRDTSDQHDIFQAGAMAPAAAAAAAAAATTGTAAAAAGARGQELPLLKHLSCYGFDDEAEDIWALSWVCAYSSLTSLHLLFVSAGEVDFEAVAQLQQLCNLEIHYFPDELLTSAQLAPLASCSQLTCLRLDSLVIEPGRRPAGTAAPAAAADEVPLRLGNTAAAAAAASALGTGTGAGEAAVLLPQLTSLQKLVAGVLCKAPVATFAPNLTQLRDVSVLVAACLVYL